jgi:PAS domain S-box-containing protein
MRKSSGKPESGSGVVKKISDLKKVNKRHIRYIRSKTNQLLKVMGTKPLNPEELEDNTLLDLDPIGIVARSFGQVLSHLKETNKELTEARDEMQAIFDATGVGISIIDTNFKIIKCNEKQREFLMEGKSGKVTGRFCHDVCCKLESPRLGCPAVDTLASGKPVIQMGVLKKGKYFQVITSPLKNEEGSVTGVIEVLLDISEKKRAEFAEKEQRGFYLAEKLKLATIIQSLSDGLFVTGSDGTIISFNAAAHKITGLCEQDVLGMNWQSFFRVLSPRHLSEDFGNTELNVMTPDKRRLILHVTSSCVKDGDNKETGKVFTLRDVTEEIKRREIFHRTEKLVALGQLSAGVAHELNTPLGSILGYARLLLREENLDSHSRERLETIAEQAKRGSSIIDGLLNFSRHSNPFLMNLQLTDVNDVISRVLKILSTETEKRGITVSPELGSLPLIKADKRQMEQVIFNIVLNSVQALRRKKGRIRVRTSGSGGNVKVEIIDNGPGIPEEIRSKIFDPFFTTKPVGKGTGLGLSICAGIVNEHGGAITLDCAKGSGAVFVITLPSERNLTT